MPGAIVFKNGLQILNRCSRAADHQAVAALQTPNAAAGTYIDILNSLGRQFRAAPDVIDVVGIAAVDQDVT